MTLEHVTSLDNTGEDAGHVSLFGGVLTITDSLLDGGSVMGGYGAVKATSASISGSTISNITSYGATIDGDGTLTLDQTQITGNRPRQAVIRQAKSALLTISNSTIADNTTTAAVSTYEAGIIVLDGGGQFTNARISTSTISGNSCSGAGAISIGPYSGDLTISDSTISGNTGGVAAALVVDASGGYYTSTLTIDRSILAAAGTLCSFGRSSSYAGSDNLTTDTSCTGVSSTATTVAALDLQPLADNGGATPTHAITAASSARDAAGTGCLGLSDQRGLTRYADFACDVGAFEFSAQSGSDFVVNEIGDDGDGTCTELAGCTLRDAVASANASGDLSTITFDDRVFTLGGTVTLTAGELVLQYDTNIVGAGTVITRTGSCTSNGVSEAGEFRLFSSEVSNIALSDLTLSNGCADGTGTAAVGGAVYVSLSNLTLSSVTLSGNTARSDGGAVGSRNAGTIRVSDSTFSDNRAGNGGGALYLKGTDSLIERSLFSGNSASSYGGVMYLLAGQTASFRNSTFVGNSAGAAGAFYVVGGSLSVDDSTFSGNSGVGTAYAQTLEASAGSATLTRSVVVGGSGTQCALGGGSAGSDSFATDASCGGATVAPSVDIALGALADNGGAKQTMLPQPGSVLVDATTGCSGTDQRGSARAVDADGSAGSDCDVGAVEVQNVPVVAVLDTAATNEDATSVTGNVLDNDTDSASDEDQALAVIAVDGVDTDVGAAITPAAGGTLTINGDGSYQFNPGTAFQSLGRSASTTVSVAYTVSDGHAESQSTLAIDVAGANDAPTAADIGSSPDEDSTLSLPFFSSDVDSGDTLTYSLAGSPAYGSVALNGSSNGFVFDPGSDFQDLDTSETREVSFGYQVSDGLASVTGTVTLTVRGVNDAPVAADGTLGASASSDASSSVSATDVENDPLTYALETAPSQGHVVLDAAGNYTFQPGNDFDDLASGEQRAVTFTYRVTDDGSLSDTGTVTVTVTGVDDAPVAADQTVSVSEDGFVQAAYPSSDADGDPLTHTIIAAPSKGSVADQGDGTFRFDSNGAFEALDSGDSEQVAFIYRASDGTLSDTGTITITVNGANDAPTAVDDSAAGSSNRTLVVDAAHGVLANDSDIDGDALVAVAGSYTPAGIGGTLVLAADGSFQYTPPTDTTGSAVLSYTVSDGDATATALLTITVSTDPSADLMIAKSDGVAVIQPDDVLTYTISVLNDGPADSTGARVQDLLPTELGNATWTCAPVGAALCGNASGTGDIDEPVDIPAGDAVQFQLTATVTDATAPIVNTATVTPPTGQSDNVPSNNSATDTDQPVKVFADGFEPAPVTRPFSARSATLDADSLIIADDGHPTLVLRAVDRSTKLGDLLLVHARRTLDGNVELRISRLEHGEWTVGRWQPLTDHRVELRW